MRISLILLSILALLFIGSISWSLISQDWGLNIKKVWTTGGQGVDNLTIETWKNQIKTDQKIEKLSAMVEELAKRNGVQTPWSDNKTTSSSETGTSSTPAVRVSWKLLSLLMPTATLTQIQNNWIFDLHVFDIGTQYSTYEDSKLGLKIIATSMTYDTFLKNANALWVQVYKINEVHTFPFRSFYLNPPKADTLVRLVVEMEWQSIWIEIPKTKFTLLKSMLLDQSDKTNTKTTSSTKVTNPIITNVTQKKSGVVTVQVSKPGTSTGTIAPKK